MKIQSPRETTGHISIKDKAIAEIVGLAALEVPGVISLKGNFLEEMVELFWHSLPYTGVNILFNERDIAIKLSICARYGVNLGEVAAQVQDKVREAVENMTGLTVGDIHVTIVQIRPPLP